MTSRKILLQTHKDLLVNDEASVPTKAVIVGALAYGKAGALLSIGDMRDAKPILDAIDASLDESISITEDQWKFLKEKVETTSYAMGGRAILAAIDDILGAEIVHEDERETSP